MTHCPCSLLRLLPMPSPPTDSCVNNSNRNDCQNHDIYCRSYVQQCHNIFLDDVIIHTTKDHDPVQGSSTLYIDIFYRDLIWPVCIIHFRLIETIQWGIRKSQSILNADSKSGRLSEIKLSKYCVYRIFLFVEFGNLNLTAVCEEGGIFHLRQRSLSMSGGLINCSMHKHSAFFGRDLRSIQSDFMIWLQQEHPFR